MTAPGPPLMTRGRHNLTLTLINFVMKETMKATDPLIIMQKNHFKIWNTFPEIKFQIFHANHTGLR